MLSRVDTIHECDKYNLSPLLRIGLRLIITSGHAWRRIHISLIGDVRLNLVKKGTPAYIDVTVIDDQLNSVFAAFDKNHLSLSFGSTRPTKKSGRLKHCRLSVRSCFRRMENNANIPKNSMETAICHVI